MTAQIIEFKTRATYPGSEDPQPKFVIEIYELPGGKGFDWRVHADDPISEAELSGYLGDMFLMLNPGLEPEEGIFRRAATFIRNLFAPWRP